MVERDTSPGLRWANLNTVRRTQAPTSLNGASSGVCPPNKYAAVVEDIHLASPAGIWRAGTARATVRRSAAPSATKTEHQPSWRRSPLQNTRPSRTAVRSAFVDGQQFTRLRLPEQFDFPPPAIPSFGHGASRNESDAETRRCRGAHSGMVQVLPEEGRHSLPAAITRSLAVIEQDLRPAHIPSKLAFGKGSCTTADPVETFKRRQSKLHQQQQERRSFCRVQRLGCACRSHRGR